MEEKRKVSAVVTHDAGGARVIAAYVGSNLFSPKLIIAKGPAENILKDRFPSIDFSSDLKDLEALNPEEDFVLTGTSYPATLEKDAWLLLQRLRISHAAYLDHWVNYWARFDKGRPLPDEIWVGDKEALEIALNEGFPEERLRLVPNFHFKEVKSEIALLPTQGKRAYGKQRLLFLCEPISQDAKDRLGDENALGFTEITLVKYLIDKSSTLSKRYSEIFLRPHPLEHPLKFDQLVNNQAIVKISHENNYLLDIVNSDTVLAVESMGLVIALLAGKEAVSIVPTTNYKCHLPQKDVRHIKSLEELL